MRFATAGLTTVSFDRTGLVRIHAFEFVDHTREGCRHCLGNQACSLRVAIGDDDIKEHAVGRILPATLSESWGDGEILADLINHRLQRLGRLEKLLIGLDALLSEEIA